MPRRKKNFNLLCAHFECLTIALYVRGITQEISAKLQGSDDYTIPESEQQLMRFGSNCLSIANILYEIQVGRQRYTSTVSDRSIGLPDYSDGFLPNIRPGFVRGRKPTRKLQAVKNSEIVHDADRVAYYTFKPLTGIDRSPKQVKPPRGKRYSGTTRPKNPDGEVTVTVTVHPDDAMIARPPQHRSPAWTGEIVTGKQSFSPPEKITRLKMGKASSSGSGYKDVSMNYLRTSKGESDGALKPSNYKAVDRPLSKKIDSLIDSFFQS